MYYYYLQTCFHIHLFYISYIFQLYKEGHCLHLIILSNIEYELNVPLSQNGPDIANTINKTPLINTNNNGLHLLLELLFI